MIMGFDDESTESERKIMQNLCFPRAFIRNLSVPYEGRKSYYF